MTGVQTCALPIFNVPDTFTTAVYYVNDSDGDTLFFDSDMNIVKRVTPKKGRLALFDGTIFHAKEPSRKQDFRAVVNINVLGDNLK